jgi:predicted NUDIX family phosphoesterase
LTHLDAAAAALARASKPLSAKEIVEEIKAGDLATISGLTPWKTITARLSQDILRNGPRSRFKRTFHGRFALQHWTSEPDFQVRRRVLSPLDETIKAVPRPIFNRIARAMANAEIDPVDFRVLVSNAVDVDRRIAESDLGLVQLIPTFVVSTGNDILTYRRTKRLPEARLHHALCVNFGGHMQADDAPSLFWDDDKVFSQFLLRELYEELAFDPHPERVEPIGMIHLRGNDFEKQHAGLAHLVRLTIGTSIQSLEPGMHTDLCLVSHENLQTRIAEFDTWSQVLIGAVDGLV